MNFSQLKIFGLLRVLLNPGDANPGEVVEETAITMPLSTKSDFVGTMRNFWNSTQAADSSADEFTKQEFEEFRAAMKNKLR